jgi:DNA-binding transcriptional LysR family regulator
VTAAEGLRAAVLAHLGFAIVSGWLFEAELKRGDVITVLEGWKLPSVSLWALYPTGRQPNAKIRSFVDFVMSRLGTSE